MEVQVRPMTLADVLEILSWPKYEEVSNTWANLPAASADEAAAWLHTYQKPPQSNCYAIVNTCNQLVARCNLAFLDEVTRVGGLFNFSVRRDMSDMGYGQAAVKAMLELGFNAFDMSAIYLYTGAANQKARHIYTKFGFKYMGTHYDHRPSQGYIRFVDMVIWRQTWLDQQLT